MEFRQHPRVSAGVGPHLAKGEKVQAAFPAMAVHWALFALAIGAPAGVVAAFLQDDLLAAVVLWIAIALAIWALLGLMKGGSVYRTVVATNRRLLVFTTAWWSATRVQGIVGEYPRKTTLGPHTGLWFRIDALGDPLWVHRRFARDVAATDAAAAR